MTTEPTTTTRRSWLWKAPLAVAGGLAIAAALLAVLFAIFDPNLIAYYTSLFS